MEHFVIIVNGWKRLTIITKSSILDAAAVLDPPLKLLTKIQKRSILDGWQQLQCTSLSGLYISNTEVQSEPPVELLPLKFFAKIADKTR